jgi:hypothetical protein
MAIAVTSSKKLRHLRCDGAGWGMTGRGGQGEMTRKKTEQTAAGRAENFYACFSCKKQLLLRRIFFMYKQEQT